ncbi:MAG: undecaprenyl-phosphate glucose phosphotransferase [Thermoanaerobaculia bacterium]|nr:undecaprenyl-phosphate glucose phosphotransferase [Thermoanaerobaculia bacterium]
MIHKKHKRLRTLHVLIDSVGSCLAMLAAYYLRFAVEVIPVTKGGQDVTVYTHLLPIVALLFPLAFAAQGLYRMTPSRRRSEEWTGVAIATVLGVVLLSGLLLWMRPAGVDHGYSRATLALFVACEIAIVIAGRSLVRALVERAHRAGHNLDRVLIAGNGDLARAVASRIASHRELGLDIVGYVANGTPGEIEGLTRLGDLENIDEIIEREKIEHVYVALPKESSGDMMSLLDRLVRHVVSIHVVPDLLQYMALRSRVEDLDGLPTINLSETPLEGWNTILKRAFDLVAGTIALILLSPLMLLVALLIWLDDRGPVFYRQVRMGLDGIPFEIVKFRSMRVDAEKQTGAVWAEKDDPRRTKIGAFIRRWSIDELPQLLNVLRGEMSLVGPRPERPEFVEQFREQYPHYMLRHRVRAGMTGWAQVHGWRGNTSMRMRIEHDLYYIENWSLLLDLKIMVLTVLKGLRSEY